MNLNPQVTMLAGDNLLFTEYLFKTSRESPAFPYRHCCHLLQDAILLYCFVGSLHAPSAPGQCLVPHRERATGPWLCSKNEEVPEQHSSVPALHHRSCSHCSQWFSEIWGGGWTPPGRNLKKLVVSKAQLTVK